MVEGAGIVPTGDGASFGSGMPSSQSIGHRSIPLDHTTVVWISPCSFNRSKTPSMWGCEAR